MYMVDATADRHGAKAATRAIAAATNFQQAKWSPDFPFPKFYP